MNKSIDSQFHLCGLSLITFFCLLLSCSEKIILTEEKNEEIFSLSQEGHREKLEEKIKEYLFEDPDSFLEENHFVEIYPDKEAQDPVGSEKEHTPKEAIQRESPLEKSVDGICPPQKHFATNPEHCGGCFQNCGKDKVCINGKCQCASSWYGMCDSQCVDLQFNLSSHVSHCRQCGRPCFSGEICWQGDCSGNCVYVSSRHCKICSTVKADLETNPDHCGECNKKCLDSEYCLNRICMRRCITCKKDTIYCAKECVDPKNNDEHCGYCDNKCFPGAYCEIGQCIVLYCPVCPANHEHCLCDSGCINPREDINNCGGCGRKCTPNQQKCVNGQCVKNCPSTEPTLCFNEKCVNTQTDINNCGGCGLRCGAEGESCIDGTCQCPAGKTICSHGPRYESICKCVDLQNDSKNCGECDLWCRTAQLCINGICTNFNESVLPD